ncbi:glutathione S-transferase family protein [Suttonella sp. R2A3]|uniref:glutathione S-transferase family protein n=1 Tax=Suttonella sp. R2A3 TaxID=2908648 RepID=UPI001F227BE3|nr:glutathione S-transferase family protein [Suttonella sp. R2A3]UJF24141.1 glutathione S-transferase family protein [Suttonella sp. R2A3]
MMSTLTFYTNPQSRGAVVRWLLTELGLQDGVDYTTVILQYGSDASPDGIKSANYLNINPMGKVPTLTDGDTVISETAAICAYLTDKYHDRQLAPAIDSPLRGEYYRWLFFAHGVLEPALLNHHFHFELKEEQTSTAGYGQLSDVINTLVSKLKTSHYLVGDRFSTADLYLSNALNFYLTFGLIEPLPEFQAYAARHTARESFQRAKAIDGALLNQ